MSHPRRFQATVFVMGENGAPYDGIDGMAKRIQEALETHPTLSFLVKSVKVEQVLAPSRYIVVRATDIGEETLHDRIGRPSPQILEQCEDEPGHYFDSEEKRYVHVYRVPKEGL